MFVYYTQIAPIDFGLPVPRRHEVHVDIFLKANSGYSRKSIRPTEPTSSKPLRAKCAYLCNDASPSAWTNLLNRSTGQLLAWLKVGVYILHDK